VVLYDGACGLCRGTAAVLRAADRRGALVCRPLQDAGDVAEIHGLSVQDLERELHLVRADGTVLRGFFAVRGACRATLLLWPLALVFSLPGAVWLGPQLYQFVAARRPRKCESARSAGHDVQP
jgi:predicted DCC family thiol-disulfide oxidoreductase YuxK